MKMTKSLAATMAVLALSSVSHAETIYITGSTAYRAATIAAIQAMLGGGANSTPTAQSNSTLSKASAVNWMNKTYNSHSGVNIKVSFYGSVGGVQTVSNAIEWPFLKDDASGTVSFDPTISANVTSLGVMAVPQIALSDTFQSSTPFTSNTLANDLIVGICPFRWIGSPGLTAGLSMTPLLAQAVFSNGNAPLAMLTGLATDRTTTTSVNILGTPRTKAKQLFAIGRDADSGTRLTAFAEAGIGVAATVLQYKATISSNAVTTHVPYPGATLNGIDYDDGAMGYNSGGTVATVMRATTTAIGGYYVTYLSTSDSSTALAAADGTGSAATALKWNGVDYSTTAVQEGQYTFWGYEHVLYGTLSGDAAVFAPALAAAIKGTSSSTGTAATSGINHFTMNVSRPGDGAGIIAGY